MTKQITPEVLEEAIGRLQTETHVYYVNLDSVQMLRNPLPNTVKVEVEFRF